MKSHPYKGYVYEKSKLPKSERLRRIKIALLNREVSDPSKHNVDYRDEYYYVDDGPGQRRPDITKDVEILYNGGVLPFRRGGTWQLPENMGFFVG